MEVNVREWLSEMAGHVRESPFRAVLYFVFTIYLSVWYTITSRRPFGMNVYESDWDLLIILDACRVDTLTEVANEYEFIEDVDSIWSVGSSSPEWIANTFRREWLFDIRKTTYISANGYTNQVLADKRYPPVANTTPIDVSKWSVADIDDFQSHISLWESHTDETYDCVLPETVTNRAIDAGRNEGVDKLMLHYIQPHLPYLGSAYREKRDMTELESQGYQLLENGSASQEETYEIYKENLRFVLDEVSVLLENIDAEKVVITADHGESFGTWSAYGHPEGFLHPTVRKVPWVEVSASDEHTRKPDTDWSSDINVDIREHLRDLGYR